MYLLLAKRLVSRKNLQYQILMLGCEGDLAVSFSCTVGRSGRGQSEAEGEGGRHSVG